MPPKNLRISCLGGTATVLAIVHLHCRPNGAIASGRGIGLAWFATAVVSQILDHSLLAGLAEALKIPGRLIGALFVAVFIAPLALKRWAGSEAQIAPRLPPTVRGVRRR